MFNIALFFAFFLLFSPVTFGQQPLTVLQAYYTQEREHCRVDVLLALPEGVPAEAVSQVSLAVSQWASYSFQYETSIFNDLAPRPRPLWGAVSASFSTGLSCSFSDAQVSMRAASQEYTRDEVSLTPPYCTLEQEDSDCGSCFTLDTSNPCRSTASSEELWRLQEAAKRQQQGEGDKKEGAADLKDAGERFVDRFTGEIPLLHTSLLGIKTADTLGKFGMRYEPVGFFTLGLTERFDLGLGVRAFRNGGERLYFPGAEAKLRLTEEGRVLPVFALSASGNTLIKDRTLPLGSNGLRLGASSIGTFAEDAQRVGDTQFSLGLHAAKGLGSLSEVAGRPRVRAHLGALYTRTNAAKGSELGASSYTGDDLLLLGGLAFTEHHNVLSLLVEGSYSLARERAEVGAGFRLMLGGVVTDLGVGFTGAESVLVEGAQLELPARFYPRLGFSLLF